MGEIEIPVLLADDGRTAGKDEILAFLEERFADQPDADGHRAQALDKAGIPTPS